MRLTAPKARIFFWSFFCHFSGLETIFSLGIPLIRPIRTQKCMIFTLKNTVDLKVVVSCASALKETKFFGVWNQKFQNMCYGEISEIDPDHHD